MTGLSTYTAARVLRYSIIVYVVIRPCLPLDDSRWAHLKSDLGDVPKMPNP